jgi:FHA domain-containing protein
MIKINVISYDNELASEPLSAIFGPAGGSMGRGSNNALILPDPKCHISRRQASIKSDGRQHSIMNLSEVSPIFVNGKKIALATDTELQFGDEILVGLYLLRAESPFGAAPLVQSDARNGAFVSPFARDHVEAPAHMSSGPQADAMPLDLSGMTPEDSRHFADILGEPAVQDRKAAIAAPAASSASLPAAAGLLEDGDVPELNSIFAPNPPLAQQTTASDTTLRQADTVVLTQAFLRGAKLPVDSMPAGISVQWMEALGAFAAAATQNMIAQLADPMLEKHQVDPDSTNVLGANNPLKYLPNTRSALLQMFGASVPGFMSAADAIDDAGTTLRAHQSAVMAAMQAMMQETIDRLDPFALEQQVKGHTMLDSVMAANRKAKCWALYRELFQVICAEANAVSRSGINLNFLRAYEQAITAQQEKNRAGKESKPIPVARQPARQLRSAPRH